MADKKLDIDIGVKSDTSGAKQAEQALENVTQKTAALQASQEQAAVKVENLGNKSETAGKQITGNAAAATSAMGAMANLARGNLLGAVQQLTPAVNNLSASFKSLWASISPVAIAGTIGFGLGSILDRILGISDAIANFFVPAINSMRIGWDAAFESADKVANLRFDRLTRELAGILNQLDQVTKEAGFEKRLADRERAAEASADIAGIEAGMPAGTERDRAVLERRRRLQEEQRKADEDHLQKLAQAEQQAEAAILKFRAQAEADIAAQQGNVEVTAQIAKNLPGNEFAATNARLQLTTLEQMQKDFTARQAEIAKELDSLRSQRRETQTDMRVRGYQTSEEAARGQSAYAGITDRESQADASASRDSAAAAIARQQAALAAAEGQSVDPALSGRVTSAQRRADALRAQRAALGSSGMSPRSFTRQRQDAALGEDIAEADAEVNAARAALAANMQSLLRNVASLRADIQNSQSQIKNIDN